MEPSKVEYEIGDNIHHQPIKLVRCRTTGGQMSWEIHRGAANQRDDQIWIGGLTADLIIKMAEAVRV